MSDFVTVSMGIHILIPSRQPAAELVKKADVALYRANKGAIGMLCFRKK